MTGEAAPNTPKPENWNDELAEALNGMEIINTCDVSNELEKLNEHTRHFFHDFWLPENRFDGNFCKWL